MIIQHNMMALNSYNRLSGNNTLVSKNLEKLSSGFKINRAGDDAAGLAISEKMRAQITGLTRATQNSQDGISLVQTAEGQLTEVHSMLNRMVDLATQASNGTIDNDVDRKNLQKEVQSLKDEINRIAETSHFNGIKLLDGSMGTGGTTGASGAVAAGNVAATGANKVTSAVNFEITGLEAGKTVTINLVADGTASNIAADSSGNITLNLEGTADKVYTQTDIDNLIKNATLPESAKNLKVKIDSDLTVSDTDAAATTNLTTNALTTAAAKNAFSTNATNGVTVSAKKGGAEMNGKTLTFSLGSQGVTIDTNGNVAIGLETGKDYTAADINAMLSKAGADMTIDFEGTKQGSGAAAAAGTFGTGAYTLGGGAGLQSGGGLSLQIGDTADQRVTVSVDSMSVASLGLDAVDVSLENLATDSIDVIKTAINTVSSTRADLGAIQNRLEHTINNLTTTTENMTAAEARIRDTDMAKEMMAFTKNNVLAQAAQAMLAQANQQPQQVLQLLR